MGLGIVRLLEARTWRAFDVDDEGRVLAGFDETGTVQLVELAPDGGATLLTALPGACRGRYLPGERVVVVEHDDGGNERGQLALLTLDPPPAEPVGLDGLRPLVHDPEHVHRLVDVLPGRVVYLTNRRNGVDFDVVIRATAPEAEEVVYDGGGMVQDVAVSPDARHVALTVPGRPALSDQLLLVDTMPPTEYTRLIPLTDAGTPARHARPQWLAGSATLVVSTDSDRDLAGVAALDVADGAWRWLVTSETCELFGWPSPDGRRLLVEANDGGVSRLSVHDAEGAWLRELPLPAEGVVTWPIPEPVWSPDSRLVAMSFTAPAVPGDVLLADVESGAVRALTSSASQFTGELASPSVHFASASDGERVPCLVYGSGGSAVVVVHGGPEGQSRPGFHPVAQALAVAGNTVVLPNVRGSTGYGKRWYSADDGRRRLDAVADLAAVHDLLPAIGCDPARAALWGGSYGGYLVLAGLTFQPERWAAGVAVVGISSLVSFLERTSDYRRAHREREYGSLEHDRQFLHDASPLSHVDKLRAPVFVIHGANDPRVPLSEAEQLVAAVRERGVECELLVYPDEGHGLAKRANRLDAYPKAIEFLADALARA